MRSRIEKSREADAAFDGSTSHKSCSVGNGTTLDPKSRRAGQAISVALHCGADDAGRDDLDLLLRLHAVASNAAEKKMRCEVEISAPWMPKAEATDQIDSLCDAICVAS